jgi:Lytic transglycolase
MVSINYFRNLWLKVGDKRIGHRTILRPLAVILMTAPLPPVLNRPWLTRRLHYAPPIGRHRSSLLTRKGTFHRVRMRARPVYSEGRTGLISSYTESSETTSGEKFNPDALTAAHPTLPFGTRLRVTDLSNGRSLTVRINDRPVRGGTKN